MKRRYYWLLLAVLLLSLTSMPPSMSLISREGSKPNPQPLNPLVRPDGGTEGNLPVLRIRVSLSEAELSELKKISGNFTLSTGIEVVFTNAEHEEGAAALKEVLTIGDSPDIIMTDGRNIADLASRGYLLPVDVYQSVPGSSPLSALIPQMQWNGYNWGIPLDVDPYLLVYSPKRLTELGLTGAPKSLEQWGLLLEHLQAEQGREHYLLAADTRNPYSFMALWESMGNIPGAESKQVLAWMQEARSYYYLTSRYNLDIWDMLQDGKLAVALLPLSEWQMRGNGTLAAEAPAAVAFNGYQAMYSRFFALPAKSASPEEAVSWLSYITSSNAQLEWMENTGRLPALDELYRKTLPAAVKLPFAASLLLAEPEQNAKQQAGTWSDYTEAAAQFLSGKISAEQFTGQTGEALE